MIALPLIFGHHNIPVYSFIQRVQKYLKIRYVIFMSLLVMKELTNHKGKQTVGEQTEW